MENFQEKEPLFSPMEIIIKVSFLTATFKEKESRFGLTVTLIKETGSWEYILEKEDFA